MGSISAIGRTPSPGSRSASSLARSRSEWLLTQWSLRAANHSSATDPKVFPEAIFALSLLVGPAGLEPATRPL